MNPDAVASVQTAEIIACGEPWDETVDFFLDKLGFRPEMITPADNPSTMVLSGYGVRLRLVRDSCARPDMMLFCHDPLVLFGNESKITAPNGMRLFIHRHGESAPQPEPLRAAAFECSRYSDRNSWHVGRAGMLYRDLIPSRCAGAFIASHIKIPDGGPVPDYVHYHKVRFQIIYCYKGWVRVVYEDQGPPFILQAGDCVVQPPTIRHRVLEASHGLEVIEIGSPAEHDTYVEYAYDLPTPDLQPQRMYQGQRFLRHQASRAQWQSWTSEGFACRDTGIGQATGGVGGVRVVRGGAGVSEGSFRHTCGLAFFFVLQGRFRLTLDETLDLNTGDAFLLPHGENLFSQCSPDLELLQITLPAINQRGEQVEVC